jgi:hypothetical protein
MAVYVNSHGARHMSTEHTPAAFTITEFCQAHRISRSMLYKLWSAGTGPRVKNIGVKKIITAEAAAEWRAESAKTADAAA